jgi:hypothetical protein
MTSRPSRPVPALRRLSLVPLIAIAAMLAAVSVASAATITVTTTADETVTNDASSISLREGILSINSQADTGADVTANRVGAYGVNDTINFNIPGSGVKTISLGSSLPTITKPLSINGATQGVAMQGQPPLVALDGTGAGAGVDGLTTAANVTISTVEIGNFSNAGVNFKAGADGSTLRASYVGTNPAGTATAPNVVGVLVGAANATIGGTTAGSGNVISGNTGSGMLITGSSNSVLGNLIGVNSADSAKLANASNGILVTTFGSAGNTIGGRDGSRNVISGNGANGVFLNGSSSNVVAQNFIGTDSGGLTLGNGSAGVRVAGAKNNQVGGTPRQQAIIANNGDYGINANTNGNFFQGILIYNNTAGTILVAPGPTPTARTTLSADRRTINLSASGLTPSQTFSFEIYAADAQCGLRSLLGFGGENADAFGNGTGSLTLGSPLPTGSDIGALVTDGGSLGTSPTQGCPTSVVGNTQLAPGGAAPALGPPGLGAPGAGLPDNTFTVTDVQVTDDGFVSAIANVHGPGVLDLLGTTGRGRVSSSAAALLKLGRHTLAFGRDRITATAAGAIPILLQPSARGLRLLRRQHRRHQPLGLRFYVTYTPTGGHPHTGPAIRLKIHHPKP